MARTDKTRPFRVKMVDHPGNYREVHQHDKRPLFDENGEIVRVVTGEYKGSNGRTYPITKIVWVPFTECDLPDSPAEWNKHDSYCCHWTYTVEWINSGEARCGCPICTDQSRRRAERRRQRHEARRTARNWWKEYE